MRLGNSKKEKLVFKTRKEFSLPKPLVSYPCRSAFIVDSINALREAYCGVFCR